MAASESVTMSSAMSLEQALFTKASSGADGGAVAASEHDALEQPSDSAIYTRRGSLFAPGPVQKNLNTSALPLPASLNEPIDGLGNAPAGAPHTQSNRLSTVMQSPTVTHFVGDQDAKQVLLIELLLVSGKRMKWHVAAGTLVHTIKQAVWQAWPPDWCGQAESPPSPESLRL
ncbi:hypothetical protein OIV83_006127 [Microbotryomycetes sp. JL201]|nr:hypothetical protein OIV83_006127 [Microbotryomycetes sp. JL201]